MWIGGPDKTGNTTQYTYGQLTVKGPAGLSLMANDWGSILHWYSATYSDGILLPGQEIGLKEFTLYGKFEFGNHAGINMSQIRYLNETRVDLAT